MALDFQSVYVTSTGAFLPGKAVDNAALDRYIAPFSGRCERIKRRILAENGIEARHYAIDEAGDTVYSAAEMGAHAARACLRDAAVPLTDVGVLCTGSSGGDLAIPGLANMVQGELAAGPMHTSSHQGVCAAGVAALQHAAGALSLGDHAHALVVASELPSRMFKRSRFAPPGYAVDFDSHFLRWMLSDGAGAWLLSRRPRPDALSLRLDWVHTRSFSGDHPVCMQIGSPREAQGRSYLDYPSLHDAERAGAFLLRQDVRLLPHLFELGIHEYVDLVRQERIVPAQTSAFLCHYSSRKFAGVIEDLMRKVGLSIPRERWYSNLAWRGNTGAASIFIMLADFLRERALTPGQRLLCFVPESGRFTISFFQLSVVGPDSDASGRQRASGAPAISVSTADSARVVAPIAPPHASEDLERKTPLSQLVTELAGVWHDYQSRLFRTPLINKINRGAFELADYRRWMACWIPQVRYGSLWMRRAADQVRAPFEELKSLIHAHARDEQDDYQILFDDYRSVGGDAPDLESLRRNPGGEALNAFMFRLAERPNPVDLLGAVYIIEGTGQRVVPALLPLIRAQLRVPERSLRFLSYHGANDSAHLARWLRGVELVLAHDDDGSLARSILTTARGTAELYLLQFQYVL